MAQIKDALVDFNPWWKGGFKLEFKDRDVYRQVQKFLNLPQIIAFTGLRRVGKTTLMLKIAEDYMAKGFDPKRIVYFSFDEFREAEIRDVLAEYEKLTGMDMGDGKYLVLLDEVQKMGAWDDRVKAAYDVYGKKAKIIISGSETLFVRKKSKETLAGRMFEFKVEPLSFREFLAFNGVEFKPAGIYEKELSRLFEEFIISLGFPELIGISDRDVIRKYAKESIVEKVVYRDIPRLFGVRDISVVESLLNIFMEEPGQVVEISSLASDLKVSRQALSNYLALLEDCFLLRRLYNYSNNKRKTEKKLKKYYATIISPALLFKDDDFSRSKVLEWLMVNQLKAEFFWRDPCKNEVDIVLSGKKPIPIEVKYGKIDFGGMTAFMKKFDVESGYVISSNKEMKKKIDGKSIQVIPAFKFLAEYKG